VCERLRIGFHEVSFTKEYWTDVFAPFLAGIRAGGTPNPDVACNRHIKFDRFTAHALSLGADWVATGHYARVRHSAGGPSELLTAVDETKDQTYFLATIPQARTLTEPYTRPQTRPTSSPPSRRRVVGSV
jgi:tRNA U34 2-thiouridine synthase MnmA/TrmU